jgi:4-hydroxybenzoate polyprenyltransferase
LLIESGLQFLRENPFQAWKPFVWLLQGKPVLKHLLARSTELNALHLPFAPEILRVIESARSEGRSVVLATASNRKLALQIAEQLDIFDEVLASDLQRNLSAERKRDALIERFGERGFDYIGNAHDDLPVLAAARQGFLFNPQAGLLHRARAKDAQVEEIQGPKTPISAWPRALRLHQWLKNLLVFVPLLASHQIHDTALLTTGLLAFLFFGLCASSVYLLNDLLDLPEDRQHLTKRTRPFAAGQLSLKSGLIAVPLLLLAAFGGSLWLMPPEFTAVLAIYYLLTLAYSLDLKRRMLLDVMVLAALYTLRVIAGAAAFQIEPTFWMLAFSMFVFLSLAMVKRYAELHAAIERGAMGRTPGRGYRPSDLDMVAILGVVSGYLAVLVLALYIHDDATTTLYTHPELIWLAIPILLFWVGRAWMLAHRGEMHEDPVIFAVRDRTSQILGLLFGLVFWFAI